MLVAEQHLDLVLRVATTAYVIDRGRVASGPTNDLRDDPLLLR